MRKYLLMLSVFLSFGLLANDNQEYLTSFYAASIDYSAPILLENNQELTQKKEQFYKIPVSEALPALLSFLEDGKITNRIEKLIEGGIVTNQAVHFADRTAFKMMNLLFGMDSLGTIGFPWLSGRGEDLTISAVDYHYFWWYEGRKYLPQIWNSWYSCWQSECSREKPRPLVLEKLASEITGFGYHIFPFLNEHLESDESLALVVETFKKPSRGNRSFGDFKTWYQKNQQVLSLPPCETLKAAEARCNLASLPLGANNFRRMKRWQANAEKYYSNTQTITNHWYFKIDSQKDIITEEDIFNAKYVR